MPKIRQVASDTKVYKVNGIRFTEYDSINYKGIKYTGKEFYEKFKEI